MRHRIAALEAENTELRNLVADIRTSTFIGQLKVEFAELEVNCDALKAALQALFEACFDEFGDPCIPSYTAQNAAMDVLRPPRRQANG